MKNKNAKQKDFFSENPPVTMLEDIQTEVGFSRAIQPRDLAFIDLLKKLKVNNPKNVLDFGCANGIWLERFIANFPNSTGTGVDISQVLIDLANKRIGKKANYICTINEWKIPKDQYDFIFSFDTFEHIIDKELELKRLYLSMKKNGKFIFYTLNPENKYTFDWIFEKFGSDYLYRRADHRKAVYYEPKKFAQDLQKNGFKKVNYTLYDGPTNLFWHIFCYTYLSMLEKVLSNFHIKFLIKPILLINDRWLRLIHPLNNLIDQVFFLTGNSNGYFIWGEK